MLSTRLKVLSTNNIHWDSPLLDLAGKRKPSQSLLKLQDSGIQKIKDLLWIFPLRVLKAPELASFAELEIDKLFLGRAKLINIKFTPAFGRRGKGKVQLFNATCVVKDFYSDRYLNLRWFNTYPSLKKQLESYDEFNFMGMVSDYKGTLQIVNPKINPPEITNQETIIEYPTVNTINGKNVQKVINKIPESLWQVEPNIGFHNLKELENESLIEAFQVLHGKKLTSSPQEYKNKIIYQEFLENQLKVLARKLKNKKLTAPIIKSSAEQFFDLFPYSLTEDQKDVLSHIETDFNSGHPMMRMLQGDVGCGKTTVAIIAALQVIKEMGQVAFMCPTEALARQHYETLKGLNLEINIDLLLGSTKTKEKQLIQSKLINREIDLIIGTHSLFQDSVEFKQLQLAIIDEQHKFGVEQRQRLVNKGVGTHSLIMTATPIPRSLQLAQYGDLDISTIRKLPGGRKGIQTRIVTETTYQKYLSFLKTRISIGEQAYIVVPAIEESDTLNIKNVNSHLETYRALFPELRIEALHGQLKAEQKQDIMNRFSHQEIDILLSTTVIEVGINVVTATVISIYNPDRFGLSSLHQLRGRVGRGNKAGFCFLITEKNTSTEAMARLKVIESTIDGFEISEADLSNRGQGDLFGNNQSGHGGHYKIANIFEHFDVFEKVAQDIEEFKKSKPEILNNILLSYTDDTKVISTI